MIVNLKRFANRKLPLDRAIISDIVLWVVLTLVIAYVIYFFAIALPAKRGQTILLHFRDANEISKGSPVRLMGNEIGFVDDVQIRQDHVDIKIQTDPGTLKIPSGSTFTILFTGLAGAKSIEVDLPPTPQPELDGKPIYLIEEPIRMNDTLNSSIDTIQALQKGAENIADFFGKRKPVEELQFNIRQAHQMSTTAAHNTIALNHAILELNQDVAVNTLQAVEALDAISIGSKDLLKVSQPQKIRSGLRKMLAFYKRFNGIFQAQASGTISTIRLTKQLTQTNRQNTQFSQQLNALADQIAQAPLGQWLESADQKSAKLQDNLTRADAFFSAYHLSALQSARISIQDFNRKLSAFNVKLNQTQNKPSQSSQSKP